MAEEFPESVEALANLERSIAGARATVGRLHTVTALAKKLIANCDGAGLALEVRGAIYSVGVTDEVVLQVDLVQYDTREGPCLAAIDSGRRIRIDVLDTDEDWRHFAPGAIEAGVHSVLSVPLNERERTIGALNLYSYSPSGFDDEAERIAQILADHAAEVLGTSPLYAYSLDLIDHVLKEISSREVINAAIGIVMSSQRCDADEARRLLLQRAELRSETLFETAEWELREGEFRSGSARGSETAPEP